MLSTLSHLVRTDEAFRIRAETPSKTSKKFSCHSTELFGVHQIYIYTHPAGKPDAVCSRTVTLSIYRLWHFSDLISSTSTSMTVLSHGLRHKSPLNGHPKFLTVCHDESLSDFSLCFCFLPCVFFFSCFLCGFPRSPSQAFSPSLLRLIYIFGRCVMYKV